MHNLTYKRMFLEDDKDIPQLITIYQTPEIALYLSISDYKRLRPFAKKTRTKIILLEKHGLPFFLHRFRKRKVFFAGILLCVGIIYGLSLFVWNIHIQGNASQTKEELIGFLETIGVEQGTQKSKIQLQQYYLNLLNLLVITSVVHLERLVNLLTQVLVMQKA